MNGKDFYMKDQWFEHTGFKITMGCLNEGI